MSKTLSNEKRTSLRIAALKAGHSCAKWTDDDFIQFEAGLVSPPPKQEPAPVDPAALAALAGILGGNGVTREMVRADIAEALEGLVQGLEGGSKVTQVVRLTKMGDGGHKKGQTG